MDNGRLHAIERWTLGLGALFSLVAFCFGRQTGLSASIGAAIMSLNAFAIRRVGERLQLVIKQDPSVSPWRVVALFNLKLIALVVVLYLVVTRLHVNPVALLFGLSTYPLAAVMVALTFVAPEETPIEGENG